MIKVSVIVPVYKVPLNYLRECFDSLLAQTMQECEFIIVSDGAPEAECAVCEEYVQKDSRFIFFQREHAGVSAARNYGIDQVQGEYITFVDSDDWIEPKTLVDTYNFAKANNADITFWDCHFQNKSNKILSLANYSIQHIPRSILDDIIHNTYHLTNPSFLPAISMCCKLYKNSLLKSNRFNTSLAYGEDRAFNVVLFQQKQIKAAYIHRLFYNYRINDNSTTQRFNPDTRRYFLSFLSEMKKHSNGKFEKELTAEAIALFYASWRLNFLHQENNTSLKTKVQEIKSFFYSKDFQKFINNEYLKNEPFFVRLEYKLLSNKVTCIIWIHVIKAWVLCKIKRFL